MITRGDATARLSRSGDDDAIREIYNQGSIERTAALDTSSYDEESFRAWRDEHDERLSIVVAERDARIMGWASLNRYAHPCAYRGIADLSVYVDRKSRRAGIGKILLRAIEPIAGRNDFHEMLLSPLAATMSGVDFIDPLDTAMSAHFASKAS